jgi:hypothetical protein
MLTYRMHLLILGKMTHIALTEHTNQTMQYNDETSKVMVPGVWALNV